MTRGVGGGHGPIPTHRGETGPDDGEDGTATIPRHGARCTARSLEPGSTAPRRPFIMEKPSTRETMDYSIIVPVFNEERHIRGCLEALLALDHPEDRYEVIVVDNNSTDRSAEIVREYPRARLVTAEQQGDFAARNKGIVESRGEVLAFTDSDTAPEPDWLRSIGRAMEDPTLEVIVGYLRLGDAGPLAMMERYEAARGDFVFGSDDPSLYYGFTCNQIVRRSVFDELGLFPEVFRNSDTVFVRRVVDAHGCDAVRFRRDVRVRRLEVATFPAFLAKQHIYGRDYRRYEAEAAVRTLTIGERIDLFRRVARDEGYSPVRSVCFLGALAAGAAAYELGRLRGAPAP